MISDFDFPKTVVSKTNVLNTEWTASLGVKKTSHQKRNGSNICSSSDALKVSKCQKFKSIVPHTEHDGLDKESENTDWI